MRVEASNNLYHYLGSTYYSFNTDEPVGTRLKVADSYGSTGEAVFVDYIYEFTVPQVITRVSAQLNLYDSTSLLDIVNNFIVYGSNDDTIGVELGRVASNGTVYGQATATFSNSTAYKKYTIHADGTMKNGGYKGNASIALCNSIALYGR